METGISQQDSPVTQVNPVGCPAGYGTAVQRDDLLRDLGQSPLCLSRFARLRINAVSAAEALRIQHQVPRAAPQHASRSVLPTQPRIRPLRSLSPRSCTPVAPQHAPMATRIPFSSYQLLPQRRQRRLQPQLLAAGPGRRVQAQGAPHARLLRGAQSLKLLQPGQCRPQPRAHPAAVPARGSRAARSPHLPAGPFNHRDARPRRVSPPPAAGRLGGVGPIAGRGGRCLRRPRSQRPPLARPVGTPRPSTTQPLCP